MKPIYVYKVAVYQKDNTRTLTAEEISDAVKTEIDGTYYLNVMDIEYLGVIKTELVSHGN